MVVYSNMSKKMGVKRFSQIQANVFMAVIMRNYPISSPSAVQNDYNCVDYTGCVCFDFKLLVGKALGVQIVQCKSTLYGCTIILSYRALDNFSLP
jgi:hypothetical protein